MGVHCCVKGCTNTSTKKLGLSFHQFPGRIRYADARKKWIEIVRADRLRNGLPWEPPKHAYVCGLHFIEGRPTFHHPLPELLINGELALIPKPKQKRRPRKPKVPEASSSASAPERKNEKLPGGRKAKKQKNDDVQNNLPDSNSGLDADPSPSGIKRIRIAAPDGGELTMMVPKEEDPWLDMAEQELGDLNMSGQPNSADSVGQVDLLSALHEENFSACAACVRGYSDVNQLQSHLLLSHSRSPDTPSEQEQASPTEPKSQGSFECCVCSKIFTDKALCDQHLQNHILAATVTPVKMRSILRPKVLSGSKVESSTESTKATVGKAHEEVQQTAPKSDELASQNCQPLSDSPGHIPVSNTKQNPILQGGGGNLSVPKNLMFISLGKPDICTTTSGVSTTTNKEHLARKKVIVFPINAIQTNQLGAPSQNFASIPSKSGIATSPETVIKTLTSKTLVEGENSIKVENPPKKKVILLSIKSFPPAMNCKPEQSVNSGIGKCISQAPVFRSPRNEVMFGVNGRQTEAVTPTAPTKTVVVDKTKKVLFIRSPAELKATKEPKESENPSEDSSAEKITVVDGDRSFVIHPEQSEPPPKKPVRKRAYRKSTDNFHLYSCELCPRKFERSDQQELHMKTHLPNYWTCEFCEYPLPSLAELDTHKFDVHLHEPVETVIQEIVEEEQRKKKKKKKKSKKDNPGGSGSKKNLSQTYLCDICGYSSLYRYNLKMHIETHSATRKYACDICGKKFTTPQVCATHRKRHSNVRNFPCPDCPKAFKDKSALKQHMMFHDDIRPYECDICGRAFHTRQNTRTHRLRHFSDKYKARILKDEGKNVSSVTDVSLGE